MPTELTVPVHAPGATQAAQQIQGAAVAADRLAAAEAKASAAADKLAASQQKVQTATQRAADAMKRGGQVVGGVGGGVLSRAGGAIGGQFGLAGGGAAIAFAAVTIGLQRLEAAAASTEQRLTALANVTKAASEAAQKVRDTRSAAALSAAGSSRTAIARLLASGVSLEDIQAAGPGGLASLEKMGKRQRGSAIGIATEAARISGGAFTVEDILASGVGRDARSSLAKALGVGIDGLDAALAKLKPAAGFFSQVGGEEQARQTRLGRDMMDTEQLTLGIAQQRKASDELLASTVARAEAERAAIEQLQRRAEAEGAILRIWRNSWLSSSKSGAVELREAQDSFSQGR